MSNKGDETLLLNLYDAVDGYIGKLNVPGSYFETRRPVRVETVVIVDNSGSMGFNVQKLTQQILPAVFSQLNYKNSDPVVIITFETESQLHHTTVGNIEKLGLRAEGCTFMAKALANLKSFLQEKCQDEHELCAIRLLTISDGMLDDQEATIKAASEMDHLLFGKLVNSQAVRFFTSKDQPDTRGLASVLQLGNTQLKNGGCGLIDIVAWSDMKETVKKIANLFTDDGLTNQVILSTEHAIMQHLPWNDACSKGMRATAGENVIWLKELPSEVSLDGQPMRINNCGPLTLENAAVIEHRVFGLINRLKLLNVVHSDEAVAEMERAKIYLERWSGYLEKQGRAGQAFALKGRLHHFKNAAKRRMASAFHEMARVANDQKVYELNAAQMANYLRVINAKDNRAIARRALKAGIDFRQVLQEEISAMRRHLNELDGVDDGNHQASFFSLATTFTGIKYLCELYDDSDAFEAMDTMEILQMANIVGIACQGPVGDFSDPMVWSIWKIFPHCFVSISDVIATLDMSRGFKYLNVPATKPKQIITNVVPYFEDDRVQVFLQKYAPNLLDYTCSLGMRKLLTGVPKTYMYTVAAGIRVMVRELNRNKFEKNIKVFCQLVHNYDLIVSKKTFTQEILDCINKGEQRATGKLLSLYLANNTTQNLIGPLIQLAKDDNLFNRNVSGILRALYATEVYLIVKKWLAKEEGAAAEARSLIGIDLVRRATFEGSLFEEVIDPKLCCEFLLNEKIFNKLAALIAHIDFITLLPKFLVAAFTKGDPVPAFKAMAPMSEKSICQALGIDYDLKTFKFYNIVQAIAFNKQSLRCNEQEQRMSILDLGTKSAADEFMRCYVRSIYEADYMRRLGSKRAREAAVLSDILVERLVSANSIFEYKQLLKDGIVHKGKSFRLTNSSSSCFNELAAHLISGPVTDSLLLRLQKIQVLLSGRDHNTQEVVWNRGCSVRGNVSVIAKFEEFFKSRGESDSWSLFLKSIPNETYRYRDGPPNRHTHSNEKPSYWAFGYANLKDYFDISSSADRELYTSIHKGCCGFVA